MRSIIPKQVKQVPIVPEKDVLWGWWAIDLAKVLQAARGPLMVPSVAMVRKQPTKVYNLDNAALICEDTFSYMPKS